MKLFTSTLLKNKHSLSSLTLSKEAMKNLSIMKLYTSGSWESILKSSELLQSMEHLIAQSLRTDRRLYKLNHSLSFTAIQMTCMFPQLHLKISLTKRLKNIGIAVRSFILQESPSKCSKSSKIQVNRYQCPKGLNHLLQSKKKKKNLRSQVSQHNQQSFRINSSKQ